MSMLVTPCHCNLTLICKADDSAADAARLLHKDVMRLQQEAGIVHHSR